MGALKTSSVSLRRQMSVVACAVMVKESARSCLEGRVAPFAAIQGDSSAMVVIGNLRSLGLSMI